MFKQPPPTPTFCSRDLRSLRNQKWLYGEPFRTKGKHCKQWPPRNLTLEALVAPKLCGQLSVFSPFYRISPGLENISVWTQRIPLSFFLLLVASKVKWASTRSSETCVCINCTHRRELSRVARGNSQVSAGWPAASEKSRQWQAWLFPSSDIVPAF